MLAQTVEREEVRRLQAQGARIVEVLPEAEYQLEHLPGAINLPLKQLDRAAVAQMRPDEPIVVYCNDSL